MIGVRVRGGLDRLADRTVRPDPLIGHALPDSTSRGVTRSQRLRTCANASTLSCQTVFMIIALLPSSSADLMSSIFLRQPGLP